jgi:hypothetical protein
LLLHFHSDASKKTKDHQTTRLIRDLSPVISADCIDFRYISDGIAPTSQCA